MTLGGTVGELQQKMGWAEVMLWQSYFKKHGRPSMERKFDRPAALISSMLSSAHGGKAKYADFMPYPRNDFENPEGPPSLEAIIAKFGGVKRA